MKAEKAHDAGQRGEYTAGNTSTGQVVQNHHWRKSEKVAHHNKGRNCQAETDKYSSGNKVFARIVFHINRIRLILYPLPSAHKPR